MLFSNRVRVRVRVKISREQVMLNLTHSNSDCVWLVSGYAHVFMLQSVVTVTLPFIVRTCGWIRMATW